VFSRAFSQNELVEGEKARRRRGSNIFLLVSSAGKILEKNKLKEIIKPLPLLVPEALFECEGCPLRQHASFDARDGIRTFPKNRLLQFIHGPTKGQDALNVLSSASASILKLLKSCAFDQALL
jgi:hypothetical protein